MASPIRGHRPTGTLFAAVIAAASACASNPPPAPARSLSVRGVFDCGLSVMAGSGWEVASPPGGPRMGGEAEPEYLIALLQRGDSQVALDVRRTDQGAIAVAIRSRPPRPLAAVEQLEQQIKATCVS